MKMLRGVWAALLAVSLVACGGGGGGSGSDPFPGDGSGSGGNNGGDGGTTGQPAIALVIERGATAVTQISSTETVSATARVTDADGAPVEGVVVRFSESDGSLLSFAPTAATALTDSDGMASVDLQAAATAGTGATTIQADATVDTVTVTGTRSVQITAGNVDPTDPPEAAAINFIGSSPADTAIVIKGSGGNGRSESAILSFRVVDAANAPIGDAVVNFELNANNGGATIVQDQATSNSSGVVAVTVSSGTSPASIVVSATVASNPAVGSQSDTLIVSNSVGIQEGFEIGAATYNIDGRVSGTETTITARVRDEFGNPVPDGMAINFTTDLGVVASSGAGGCITDNGACTVTFRVQAPRGDGLATVIGEGRVGASTLLSDRIQINMAAAAGTPYLALNEDGTLATDLDMGTSCKRTFTLLLSDGSGRAAAAETAITSPIASSGMTVALRVGSPVDDSLSLAPTGFGFEVDLTGDDVEPTCVAGGAATSSGFLQFDYTSPGGVKFSQRIGVQYPVAP